MSIKDKLISRKFWATVVGAVMGVAMVFGLDEGIISTVAGSIVAVASLLTYTVVEGVIDTAALKSDVAYEIEFIEEEN